MAIQIQCGGPWLVVKFSEEQICLSWAIVGGGRRVTDTVAWYYLHRREEDELDEPVRFLRGKLAALGMPNAVGLLTARKCYGQVECEYAYRGLTAHCIATVGLKNALRVADLPASAPPAGTINVLCWVSVCLSEQAELEALALISEARTAAMLAFPTTSTVSGASATGTGTDYFVLAHSRSGEIVSYAGKHTEVGHVIGKVVYDALCKGIEQWQNEFLSATR